MAAPTKQYGLILSQKKGLSKTSVLSKPSVFGDDSDDETSVGESLQKEAIKKKMMKQTRLEMQKALEQDSTVYDYDAVYDDMQKQKLESNQKVLGGADKRPKYIHQLMKAVEERKKEQERRDERKIQKEREAEGEKFADKEAYVTSAYKKKLEEQKEELERERRQAEIEAALDVKKQNDLSGFYRHLLNQTVGEEAIPDRSAEKGRSEISELSKEAKRTSPAPSPRIKEEVQSSGSDQEDVPEQKTGFNKPGGGSLHPNRQYRQRSPSSGSGEEKKKDHDRERSKKSHRDRDRNRGRDRDDRHGDRRKDRDRERVRDDRSRGRRDSEREDRHKKHERSPKERHSRKERSPKERERNGIREKRRHSEEDQKDRRQDEEKDGKKEQQQLPMREENHSDKEEVVTPTTKEKEEKTEHEEEKGNKFAKRSTDQTVSSARERFMARQMARAATKSYIEREED